MMRTVRLIFARTCGRLLPSPTTALAVAGFLGLSSGFFVHALLRGDGGYTPVAALWAVASVPFLPVLASLLTMRLIADERASGLLDMLLVTPIFERDIVYGKFLGAFSVLTFALVLYALVPCQILPRCAPALAEELTLGAFLPAFAGLLLQGALWCAVGLMASAAFRHAASAAFAGLVLVLALPHAVYQAALAWSPALRAHIADLPFATHAVDFATGVVPLSAPVFYIVLSAFALFAATKTVAATRLRGRGARGLRVSTAFVTFLAFVFSCLAVALVMRCDFPLEMLGRDSTAKTSDRTYQIFKKNQGTVQATCCISRKAPEYRAVVRLMRGLEATAQSAGGMGFEVSYVDPRWELGVMNRLSRLGAKEGTVLFQWTNPAAGHKRTRHVSVPVRDLFPLATNSLVTVTADGICAGETACASSISNLTLPARRDVVYWTIGHGESDCGDYDSATGFSDIARDLYIDGYRMNKLDLATTSTIPADCAVLVVAGAKAPFARSETDAVAAWLENGGRMLVLASSGPNAGIGQLLAQLGVKTLPFTVVSPSTFTGTDVVLRDFGDHVVTMPLKSGCTVVFDAPTPLVAAKTELTKNATFTELVKSDGAAWGETDIATRPWTRDVTTEPAGPFALGIALECKSARNISQRPMRVVVFGDAGFVSNGALSLRANANRDLFFNSLAWLAGIDAISSTRVPGSAVVTGMTRKDWIRFGAWSALGLPLAVLLLGAVFALRRGGRA